MRRMRLTLRVLLNSLLIFVGFHPFAQNSVNNLNKGCKPPINRARWHDVIDKEQEKALRAFSTTNEELGYHVRQSITKKVDDIQCQLEKDSTIKDQQKVGYLRGISNFLNQFTSLYRSKQFTASHFPSALETFNLAINRDKKGESIEKLIEKGSYEVGKLVLASDIFGKNPGYKISQQNLLWKYCIAHPEQ